MFVAMAEPVKGQSCLDGLRADSRVLDFEVAVGGGAHGAAGEVKFDNDNPSYTGCGIRMMVCHSGASGAAQDVANAQGVPVWGPTDRVGTDRLVALARSRSSNALRHRPDGGDAPVERLHQGRDRLAPRPVQRAHRLTAALGPFGWCPSRRTGLVRLNCLYFQNESGWAAA